MPTTAGNRTSVGISNRCRDSGYGSALERLKAALGSTGYLWLANYDGTSRMNPNWLADTDTFGAAWTKAGITVTTGQADPGGGTSAVKLDDDGTSGPIAARQDVAVSSPAERWFIRMAFKAGGAGENDKQITLGIYNQTAGGPFPAQTTSIVSGPGSVVSGPPNDLTNLSETQWTVVEVSLDAAATAGNNYRVYIYPGTNDVASASAIYAFRPTVEAAGHDGILWSTGATAPQPPAKWDDMIQGLSAAPTSAPYLRWNSATNDFEMAFDGTDDLFATAPVGDIAQPNTLLVLAQLANTTGTQRLVDGVTVAKLHTFGEATNWEASAGTTLDSGDAPDTSLHLHRALFNGASSEIWLDGTSIGSGDAGAQPMSGFTLGAADGGSSFMEGAISSVAFIPSSPSAAQAAYIETLINQLHNQAVTLP